MRVWRILLAVIGIGLAGYGLSQLLTQVPSRSVILLGLWLVVAFLIHEGVLAPAVVAVGWLLRRYLRDRARRYLQFALILAAMITVIAVPLIYRSNREPPSKALLRQDFSANLALLLAGIGILTLAAYAIAVARSRSRPAQPQPQAAHEAEPRTPS
ncbi:MAG TPA: hypothetical protein VFP89_03305 [Propionibacteriaceae bacterium]|nr:hypothetical protein [Propionibacteriaceae bacterium]